MTKVFAAKSDMNRDARYFIHSVLISESVVIPSEVRAYWNPRVDGEDGDPVALLGMVTLWISHISALDIFPDKTQIPH